jgi:hypothetical protein
MCGIRYRKSGLTFFQTSSGLGLRRLEHEGKPRSLEASLVDVTGINDNWSKKIFGGKAR